VTAPYDEFAFLPDNAAEAGLDWSGPPAVVRRQVDLPGGGTISALAWGTGPPAAVLVHGGSQNAHTWDTVALALGRPLLAVDLPGHGHSSWRADHDYTPGGMAPDVARAAAVLAPGAGVLVGMSLGGLTSLALLAAEPAAFDRLILVDITPGVNAEKAKAVIDFTSGPTRFASLDEILRRTIEHNPTRSEASLRRGVMHNAREQADRSWSWRWDPGRGERTTDLAQLWDGLGALTVPLTLVRGGASLVVDDDDVAELLRRRPDAEVVVVDGAGHSIQGDRPTELAALIAERLPAQG
jgi:pimeloyl-ACP methyl ester carboxylesterase